MSYNQSTIDITREKLKRIATGSSGDVYRYKNLAVKIFRDNQNPPIDLETAEYLTTIHTDRILLPKAIAFYNMIYSGYAYKLVQKKATRERLITLPREELVGNVKFLEKDTRTLSRRKVLLTGIEPSNCIFNGDLYIADPREYSIMKNASPKELEALNKYQIHMLLTSLITSEIKKQNLDPGFERYIRKLLESKELKEDTSEFLRTFLRPEESIKQLSKRI